MRRARIVFPESADHRVLSAAARVVRQDLAEVWLIGSRRAIETAAADAGVVLPEAIRFAEPRSFEAWNPLVERLGQHWTTRELDRATMLRALHEPLTFAAALVRAGFVDGCVCGAATATRDVIRTALRVIGLAPGIRLVSSAFLMVLPDERALTFADCGVVPAPSADELATIAVSSARTHVQLTGESPVIAMLSFSTNGSADHESVDRVRDATARVRQMAPELCVDGELQFDAAFVEAVGERKAPGSSVAGRANVFIFPTLDAGNIGYKIAERLGGAQAIGPILQGLARPMHDLSRGCRVDDIVMLAAVCALQAVPALPTSPG